MQNDNEIMTLSDVAEYLKLSERSILRMIKKREIPVTKIGSQWRFMKLMIDEWLISRMQLPHKSDVTSIIEQNDNYFFFTRLLKKDYIITDIKPGPKKFILEQLLTPLKNDKILNSDDLFLNLLLERENMVSTAILNGVALPHIRDPKKAPYQYPFIVFGICPSGTDYHAPDQKQTFFFFLTGSNSEISHLKILSKIAFLINHQNFTKMKKNLIQQSPISSENIYNELIKMEQSTFYQTNNKR